ncbi:MAG: response regulator transcription factor [Planctomycetaceae bacterium]|nr:response regulator transcription factor [Planctomycetaceae bacterium]
MSKSEKARATVILTKVLLVEDHPIVRQGVRMVVERESDLCICGETDNAVDALVMMAAQKPDVVLIDLSLKDSSGLDLIRQASTQFPDLRMVVLSMRDEALYAERVLRSGAMGYITKEENPANVIEGIRTVLRGNIYISGQMSSKVLSRFANSGTGGGRTPFDTLTDRELEIFELIGNGLPTREIAQRLHISSKTVDSHRENIKDKLKCSSASRLLRQAIHWVQYQEC